MKIITALRTIIASATVTALAWSPSAPAQKPTAVAQSSDRQGDAALAGPRYPAQIFATTCGWCHHKGGREAGKGPQLMGTSLTDGEIIYRIKMGKQGFMPAFGTTFSEDEIKALV